MEASVSKVDGTSALLGEAGVYPGDAATAVAAATAHDLHEAAESNMPDVVRALLDAGADVNARDADGNTPLHRAAYAGHVRVLDVCLAAGAIVDATNNDGWTPLHKAALHGHPGTIATLLRAGAQVDARGKSEWTPLHTAAYSPYASAAAAVRELLAAGASTQALTADNRTPLDWAREWGDGERIALLFEAVHSAAAAPPSRPPVAAALHEAALAVAHHTTGSMGGGESGHASEAPDPRQATMASADEGGAQPA